MGGGQMGGMMGMGGSSSTGPVVRTMKPGDWSCPNQECGFHNFASRSSCKGCQTTRPGYQPGDWTCGACREHNMAAYPACMKCQAAKPTNLA
mmetsp:Transcript_108910/g.347679  ORF Transcript_108910/g.347679 Transcript_108910/m.347679 type:complete len:92 (+) Transcript_108910:1-276(+)